MSPPWAPEPGYRSMNGAVRTHAEGEVIERLELNHCTRCGALVEDSGKTTHTAWHDRIEGKVMRTTDHNAVWDGASWTLRCDAPPTAPCHDEYECDCEVWPEFGVEDGKPFHVTYAGEKHYGKSTGQCGNAAQFDAAQFEDLEVPVRIDWGGGYPEFNPVDFSREVKVLTERLARVEGEARMFRLSRLAEEWQQYRVYTNLHWTTIVRCGRKLAEALSDGGDAEALKTSLSRQAEEWQQYSDYTDLHWTTVVDCGRKLAKALSDGGADS